MKKIKHKDKQLRTVTFADVQRRRKLEQPLNIKHFALLLGISYTAARDWFNLPGFPAIRHLVFWQDFVEWRKEFSGLRSFTRPADPRPSPPARPYQSQFPPNSRAAQLLAQV